MTGSLTEPKPLIFLLHGLGRTPCSMRHLQRHFEQAGFATFNPGYQGLWQSFDQCQNRLDALFQERFATMNGARQPIIAIGHSMGGLLLRALIARHREYPWRALAMLGTPNQGSVVAQWLAHHPCYRYLLPGSAKDILPNSDKILSLPEPDIPTLILRGNQNQCWYIPVTWFYQKITQGAPGDGVVTLEECLYPALLSRPVSRSASKRSSDQSSEQSSEQLSKQPQSASCERSTSTSQTESSLRVAIVDLPVHHSFMPGNAMVKHHILKFLDKNISTYTN